MKRVITIVAFAVVFGVRAERVTLMPDADADIRSYISADIGFDRHTLSTINRYSDPSAGVDVKAYVRFKLPVDFDKATNATFTLTRNFVGAFYGPYSISMLHDGVSGEADWVEMDGPGGMSWNNAPGNAIDSPSLFTDSTVVGTFTTINLHDGGFVGDHYSISGTNLLNALNADTNGYVTLMIARTSQSNSSDQWASSEHEDYSGPLLSLEYIPIEIPSTEVVLVPDADADVRSADLANVGYNREIMLISNLDPDPSVKRNAKAYVRFKLPTNVDEVVGATFTLTRSLVGAYDAPYSVSLLNDGVSGEVDWVEANSTGMNWNDAPGNIATSPFAFTNATLVGRFTSLKSANGGVAGDSYSVSGDDLITALNADANGYVTLMIGRTSQSSSSDQWASREHISYDAPTLTLKYIETFGYDVWMAQYPGVGVATNMTDDPDQDGLNNLYEWGLGGNPDDAGDQGHRPAFGPVDADGTRWFEYIYAKRNDADALGLTYYLEQNTNLVVGAWTNDNYEVVGAGVLNGEFNAVTNRMSMEEQSKQFLRLIIESD